MSWFQMNTRRLTALSVTPCMFLGALFLLQPEAFAQQFYIKRVELAEGKVNVYYDLIDSVANRKYTINAFGSLDNFISPLQKVTGDVGTEVKPGPNKKVTWDAPAELGTAFSGKVSIEIRGKVFIPFIRMDDLNKTFKRSKPYDITWTGGRSNNIMNFDLYRGDDKISTFPNVANAGHYTIKFPPHVKPGTYKFKISDTKNKDEVVYTETFKIKRKVPLLVKVIPILGVGAVLATLGGGGGDDGPKDIEGPPKDPDGN